MIELAHHIEILLLENDCVIIPEFGGFVAYYTPAKRNVDELIFAPPSRVIGFNPQLQMNDGTLVQSYMKMYNTTFPDATKILEKEVSRLIDILHKEGKTELANVGEIHYSIEGSYSFLPYDNKIISPSLYGLDSFEIQELESLLRSAEKKIVPLTLSKKPSQQKREIRINQAFLRNTAAAVAAIILFFYMSAPIENTYIEKENYAQLLSSELFKRIEKQSLLTTSVNTSVNTTPATLSEDSEKTDSTTQNVVKPVAVREVKVPKPAEESREAETSQPVQVKPKRLYHLIVASLVREKDGETMTEQLISQGYNDAQVVTGDGKVRVSIMSYPTRKEAEEQLMRLRQIETYRNTWLLIK